MYLLHFGSSYHKFTIIWLTVFHTLYILNIYIRQETMYIVQTCLIWWETKYLYILYCFSCTEWFIMIDGHRSLYNAAESCHCHRYVVHAYSGYNILTVRASDYINTPGHWLDEMLIFSCCVNQWDYPVEFAWLAYRNLSLITSAHSVGGQMGNSKLSETLKFWHWHI